MAFTTSCFIRKNTPELREKLEELGYRLSTMAAAGSADVLKTDIEGLVTSSGLTKLEVTDCGKNEELFLALAALRDDSDYMQWHVTSCPISFSRLKGLVRTPDGRRHVPAGGLFQIITRDTSPITFRWIALKTPDRLYHKATIAELVERFKS